MALVCVDGADVLITPPGGYVFTKLTDKIKAGAQQKLLCEGKKALIKDDIDQWIKTYLTDYIKAAYVGGKLKVDSVQVQPLAGKTTATGKQVLFADTKITINMSFIKPAMMQTPNGPVPDSAPPPPVQVKFANSGQKKANTV